MHNIKLEVFDVDLRFAFMKNHDVLMEWAIGDGADIEKDSIVDALFYVNKDGKMTMLFDLENFNLGYVVHESLHATSYIMERIGQEWDFDNLEVFCWVQEHIFNKVQKEWEKRSK